MDAVVADIDKLAEKQQANDLLVESLLDQVVALVATAQSQVLAESGNVPLELIKLESSLKKLTSKATEKHKELYGHMSKHGKLIDKAFKLSLSDIKGSPEFESEESLIVTAIALDFIRQGQFDLCNSIMKEAGLEVPEDIQMGFQDMFAILAALRQHEVKPALTWAETHRDVLGAVGVDLEFSIHKMRFIHLLTHGQPFEALQYAKKYIAPFSARDNATVGVMALPAIIKLSNLMKERRTEWSQQDELPIEVTLPEDLRFHSTFICPVSKERTTEDNPPMMLPCGHVISRESLSRLYKSIRGGNTDTTRFKCPYCPVHATAKEAERVYF
ncbi:hypothetical protein IWQ60_009681 [Tieghemiomyces parasiticus]|uniref:GID complex catalytic subunit 2 n=1 Tax=Tieghemiomyces parasiticus TaxID=78921 RepID=A0A9W7ZWU8_9FUNG|nr:hypothetical protein IWQ60_009681 [Tieghemiomyces parasiticus]